MGPPEEECRYQQSRRDISSDSFVRSSARTGYLPNRILCHWSWNWPEVIARWFCNRLNTRSERARERSAGRTQRTFRTSPPGMGVAPIFEFKSAISLVGPTKRLVPVSAILNRNDLNRGKTWLDSLRLTTALAIFAGADWDAIEFELPVIFPGDVDVGEVTFVQLRIRTTCENKAVY